MPCHKDNMLKLKVLGTVLFINTPYDSIIDRLKRNQDSRPLLKLRLRNEKDELFSLFLKRQQIYKSSDKEVLGANNPSAILEEILKIVNN